MPWVLLLTALSLFAEDSQLNTQDAVTRHASAASAALQSGDYASAEVHNRAIVRLRPQLAEAEMNLGISCFLQKKYTDSIRAFEAGLKLKPDMVNAKLFLGMSRFNLNQASAALAPLAQYAVDRPDDLQGQYFLGLCYLALDRFAEAEIPLLAARQIDRRNIDVLYHLAQSYLGQAKSDASNRNGLARAYERTVQAIAEIDPASFRIAQLRAGYYEMEGKKGDAIRELETMLQHDPKASGLHYALGCLYTEERRYDVAREQFEAEMRLDSPYPRTYLQLGHVYVALEKPDQALPLLEKALRIEPQSSGLAWVDIARAYRSMDRPDRAIAAFEKAISQGQRSSSIYYQLAIAAKKAGDVQRSRQALAMSERLRSEEDKTKPSGMQ
ncbi:MAG: tetratricopeptide repeat protein [Bryobacteraceae bacterium]